MSNKNLEQQAKTTKKSRGKKVNKAIEIWKTIISQEAMMAQLKMFLEDEVNQLNDAEFKKFVDVTGDWDFPDRPDDEHRASNKPKETRIDKNE
jgi:hypothetical protein